MAVQINGDGLIQVDGTSTTQGRVRLAEDTDNGTNYVELTAPASLTANRTITFPDSNGTVINTAPGANGNILTSDGTTWTSAALTTTQVLSATAGASVGAVGTYAFLYQTSGSTLNAGDTLAVSGTNLQYASANARSGVPTGTWRIMGYAASTQTSVWLRIA